MKQAGLLVIAISLLAASQVASAAPMVLGTAFLSGANEVPPNASTAIGFITVTLNGNLLTVDETFNGLIGGNAAAAHIHCCAPPGTAVGVAVGFPGFPPTTSGAYMHVFDLTDPTVYSASFLTFGGGTAAGAEAALLAGINNGLAYANIHDAVFPGGEIRGQITPEPATTTMIALGLAGLLLRRFRRATRLPRSAQQRTFTPLPRLTAAGAIGRSHQADPNRVGTNPPGPQSDAAPPPPAAPSVSVPPAQR